MGRTLSFVLHLMSRTIPSLVIAKNMVKLGYYVAVLYIFLMLVVLKRYQQVHIKDVDKNSKASGRYSRVIRDSQYFAALNNMKSTNA